MKFAAHSPTNKAQHCSPKLLCQSNLKLELFKIVYNLAEPALVNLDLAPYIAKIGDNLKPLPIPARYPA